MGKSTTSKSKKNNFDFYICKSKSKTIEFDLIRIIKDIEVDSNLGKVMKMKRFNKRYNYIFQEDKEIKLNTKDIIYKYDSNLIKVSINKKTFTNSYKFTKSEYENILKNIQSGVKNLKIKSMSVKKKIIKNKNLDKDFVKSKFNIRIALVDKSTLYLNKSFNFIFVCCDECKKREVLRAVLTNNNKLLEECLKTFKKINIFEICTGPKSMVSVANVLLKQKRLDTLYKLIVHEQKDLKDLNNNDYKLSYYNTGACNKFSYGRTIPLVQMSRKNREGTNALLYSNNEKERFRFSSYVSTYQIYKSITDTKFIEKLECINFDYFKVNMENINNSIFFGNYEATNFLIKKAFDNDGWNIGNFHYLALTSKNVTELKDLKKMNVSKKSLDYSITPIHLACLNSNVDILNYFLKTGEDIHIKDIKNRGLIHYASVSNTPDNLKYLINNGMDVREYDIFKKTPLMYAVSADKIENVKTILNNQNQNLNQKCKEGYSALHYAVMYDSVESLKILLSGFNIDINLKGKHGKTPIMLAAERGNWPVFKLLSDLNAKLFFKDIFKKSSLIHAVTAGSIEIVSHLLVKGSDYNEQDSSGHNALHYACAYGHEDIIEILLKAGTDININSFWNIKPISTALLKNHFGIVRKLINNSNINFNSPDNQGKTFIMNAILKFQEENYNLLLGLFSKNLISVNEKDFEGNNLLHLLANVNILNNTYETYQEYLNEKQIYIKIIKMVLRTSINIPDCNFKKQSCLDIAIKNKNKIFLKCLKDENVSFVINQDMNEKTTLFNLYNIFIWRNSMDFINKLFEQMDINHNSSIFDKKGFNFFLKTSYKLMFMLREKYNNYNEKKLEFLNKFKELTDSPDITSKKTNCINKINKQSDIIMENYSKFIDLLKDLNYDFSIRVRTVFTKYRDHEIKNAKSNNKKLNRNNISYPLPFFLIENNLNELTKDKILVNNFADCYILHLVMISFNVGIFNKLLNILISKNQYFTNSVNYYGETILYFYCKYFQSDLNNLVKITKLNEDINIPNSFNQYPVMKLFVKYNCIDEFISIIKNVKLNLNFIDKNQNNPLIYFAKNRNLKAVKYLIDQGVDINLSDCNGRSALHWSINNIQDSDETDIEQLLIESGIKINQVDIFNRSPLFYLFCKIEDTYITTKTDPIMIFKQLTSMDINQINHVDTFGNSILFYAVQRNAYLCVSMLIHQKNDTSIINKDGNDIVSYSFLFNNDNISIFLLEKDIKFNTFACVPEFEKENNKIKAIEQKYKNEYKEKLYIESNLIKTTKYCKLNDYMTYKESITNTEILIDNNTDDDSYDFCNDCGFIEEKENITNEKNNKKIYKSLMKFAYERKNETISFLLLQNNFSVIQTIKDCLETSNYKNCLKIIKFKLTKQEYNFETLFKIQSSDYNRNIIHYLGLVASKSNYMEIQQILTLINSFIFVTIESDIFGMFPVFYFGMKIKEIDLISKILPYNKTNKYGNNLINIIIQDNEYLKSDYKDDVISDVKKTYLEFIKKIIIEQKIDLNKGFLKLNSESYNIVQTKNDNKEKDSTYLIYSFFVLKNIDLTIFLLENGANINYKLKNGKTFIHKAIKKNCPHALKIINKYSDHVYFDIVLENKNYLEYSNEPYSNSKFVYNVYRDFFRNNYIKLNRNKKNISNKKNEINNNSIIDVERDNELFIEKVSKMKINKNNSELEENVDSRVSKSCVFVLDETSNKNYSFKMIKVQSKYGKYSRNTFYVLQLYFDKLNNIYVLLTAWGGICETGQNQITPFFNKELAIKEFCKIFKEKTGNDYNSNHEFESKSNKYNIINLQPQYNFEYSLFNPIRNNNYITDKDSIFNIICNIKVIKSLYNSCNLSSNHIPFGFISYESMNKASLILNRLEFLITDFELVKNKNLESIKKNRDEYWKLTNEYFQLIPTNGKLEEQIPFLDKYTIDSEKLRLNKIEKYQSYQKLIFGFLGNEKYCFSEYCYLVIKDKLNLESKDSISYKLLFKYMMNGFTKQVLNKKIREIYSINFTNNNVNHKKDNHKNVSKRLLFYKCNTNEAIDIIQNGFKYQMNKFNSNYDNTKTRLSVELTDSFDQVLNKNYNYNYCNNQNDINSKVIVFAVEVVESNHKEVTDLKQCLDDYSSISIKGEYYYKNNQKIIFENVEQYFGEFEYEKDLNKTDLNLGQSVFRSNKKEKYLKYYVFDLNLITPKYMIYLNK